MRKQKVYINSDEFKPKNEFVLVRPIEFKAEEKTESGLIISLNSNRSSVERPTMGEVIALGSDIKDIEIGNTIFWPNTDGLDFEFDDGHFILLRYVSILGSKK